MNYLQTVSLLFCAVCVSVHEYQCEEPRSARAGVSGSFRLLLWMLAFKLESSTEKAEPRTPGPSHQPLQLRPILHRFCREMLRVFQVNYPVAHHWRRLGEKI